jgi:hypothetical protein
MTLSEAHTCTHTQPRSDHTPETTTTTTSCPPIQSTATSTTDGTSDGENNPAAPLHPSSADGSPLPFSCSEDDEELAEEWTSRLDRAKTRFEDADVAAADATNALAGMSKKKSKGTARYDAGARLQVSVQVRVLIQTSVAAFGQRQLLSRQMLSWCIRHSLCLSNVFATDFLGRRSHRPTLPSPLDTRAYTHTIGTETHV